MEQHEKAPSIRRRGFQVMQQPAACRISPHDKWDAVKLLYQQLTILRHPVVHQANQVESNWQDWYSQRVRAGGLALATRHGRYAPPEGIRDIGADAGRRG